VRQTIIMDQIATSDDRDAVLQQLTLRLDSSKYQACGVYGPGQIFFWPVRNAVDLPRIIVSQYGDSMTPGGRRLIASLLSSVPVFGGGSQRWYRDLLSKHDGRVFVKLRGDTLVAEYARSLKAIEAMLEFPPVTLTRHLAIA
jgi:hypothetical protein